MGRKRTHLDLSTDDRAQLRHLLRSNPNLRTRERLQVALWAAEGELTLEELAPKAGRARATIQTWLGKYKAGGVAELLARDTPPGASSPIAARRVQQQLRAGVQAGRWQTAREVKDWLEAAHGIKRARKSMFYWLGKLGA